MKHLCRLINTSRPTDPCSPTEDFVASRFLKQWWEVIILVVCIFNSSFKGIARQKHCNINRYCLITLSQLSLQHDDTTGHILRDNNRKSHYCITKVHRKFKEDIAMHTANHPRHFRRPENSCVAPGLPKKIE